MSFYNELNRRPLFSRLVAVAMLIGLGGLSACDMLGVPGSSVGDGEARMEVRLVDAPFPFDLVDEVNVTITHVELRSDDEKVTVMDETRTFNLLELQNGVYAELGDIVIPTDHYTQARVHVEDASVLMKDGRVFDMKVPSGVVKVNLHDVVVEDGQNVALTLDFDVSQSFVVQGNPATSAGIKGFLLKPTIVSKGMKDKGRNDDEDRDDDGNFDDDDDFHGDVHIIQGFVSEIVTIDGSTFLNVSDLQIQVVPGKTKFEGFTEIDALVAGESYVKVAYVEDAETGVLVAKEVEIEDANDSGDDDHGDDESGDDDSGDDDGDDVNGDDDNSDDDSSDDVNGDDSSDDVEGDDAN